MITTLTDALKGILGLNKPIDEEKVECVYEEKICPVFSMTITSAPNRTPSFSVPTIYKIRDRIPSSSPASNVTF